MAKRKGPPRGGATAALIDPANPPEMTIDEVAELYPWQWALMRVTGLNEHKHPWRGYILAVSPNREDMSDALAREPRPSQLPPGTPPAEHYIFQAYRRIYRGPGYDEWLARVRGQSEADGPIAEG